MVGTMLFPYLITNGVRGWIEGGDISLMHFMRYRLRNVDRYLKAKITAATRFSIRNGSRGAITAGNVRNGMLGTQISRTIHSTPAYFLSSLLESLCNFTLSASCY